MPGEACAHRGLPRPRPIYGQFPGQFPRPSPGSRPDLRPSGDKTGPPRLSSCAPRFLFWSSGTCLRRQNLPIWVIICLSPWSLDRAESNIGVGNTVLRRRFMSLKGKAKHETAFGSVARWGAGAMGIRGRQLSPRGAPVTPLPGGLRPGPRRVPQSRSPATRGKLAAPQVTEPVPSSVAADPHVVTTRTAVRRRGRGRLVRARRRRHCGRTPGGADGGRRPGRRPRAPESGAGAGRRLGRSDTV